MGFSRAVYCLSTLNSEELLQNYQRRTRIAEFSGLFVDDAYLASIASGRNIGERHLEFERQSVLAVPILAW